MKQALLQAMEVAQAAEAVSNLPDVYWIAGDDFCDCTFQRIGDWTNPYLGRTLRVRLCCIWAELYKMFPQFVQEIPAYYDQNRHQWWTEPIPWDSEEMDMPVSLWHRQLAQQTGRPLDEIKRTYDAKERPKRVNKGQGRESMPAPTEQEVRRARTEQLRAAGWLLEGETR